VLIDYKDRSLPHCLLHTYYVMNINRCHIAGGSLYREQRHNGLAQSPSLTSITIPCFFMLQ